MIQKRLFFIAILACVLLPSTSEAAARLSVSPLLIDHTVEQRDVIEETVAVTNRANRLVTVYASVHDVELGAGGEIQTFVDPSMTDRTNTVTSWIEITRARTRIPAGETVELPLTIRINPQAEPGEYHAFVGFADAPTYDNAVSQVMSGLTPGVIVRISLDEDRNVFLRLDRFVIDRYVTDLDAEVMTYEIENPGEDPITPGGEVIFYDTRGNEITAVPVNEAQQTVEPGERITFSSTVPLTESYGRHKARLALEYVNGDEQTATLHDTQFFYIVPLHLLIASFVILLVLVLTITLYMHRRNAGAEFDDDDDSSEVPMFVRFGATEHDTHDHDIDLKQQKKTD